jgi:hypothetical protein
MSTVQIFQERNPSHGDLLCCIPLKCRTEYLLWTVDRIDFYLAVEWMATVNPTVLFLCTCVLLFLYAIKVLVSVETYRSDWSCGIYGIYRRNRCNRISGFFRCYRCYRVCWFAWISRIKWSYRVHW